MRRAQSTIEYIVIIGALAAALIVMGIYMKRGFQGNVRTLGDQLGDLYEPGKTTISNTDSAILNSTETTTSYNTDGTLTKQVSHSTDGQVLDRDANESVRPLN
jgi:hypothetical protein